MCFFWSLNGCLLTSPFSSYGDLLLGPPCVWTAACQAASPLLPATVHGVPLTARQRWAARTTGQQSKSWPQINSPLASVALNSHLSPNPASSFSPDPSPVFFPSLHMEPFSQADLVWSPTDRASGPIDSLDHGAVCPSHWLGTRFKHSNSLTQRQAAHCGAVAGQINRGERGLAACPLFRKQSRLHHRPQHAITVRQ